MNFLAHLLLSGDKDGVIMGNYAGDFVKGRLTEEKTADWNKDYLLGVRLHRFIDSYTDAHPVVRETKRVAALAHGKLAGIILDIYFDYFLAKYFDLFSDERLEVFAGRIYLIFQKNEYLLPEQMLPMMRAMIKQDWLTTYKSLDGIELTFNRLSRRAVFLAPISTATMELRSNEAYYHLQFELFFPELQNACTLFLVGNQP
jgi:acyl carrier protein phosphodiesterase